MSDTKQLTHNLFQLIDDMQAGRQPWSRFDEIVAPGFKAFVPGQTLDLAGFKQMMRTFGEAFSNSSHALREVVCERDVAMVCEEWKGTHSGVFLGAQPTGKAVAVLVMCLVKFVDGKVGEFYETFDTLGLMQKTGVIPAA